MNPPDRQRRRQSRGAKAALLDVNMLVALFDPMHIHHEPAHEWFARKSEPGLGHLPLTENGFVRVVSNPRYPGQGTSLKDAVSRLEEVQQSADHFFWQDSVSMCDEDIFQTALLEVIGGALTDEAEPS